MFEHLSIHVELESSSTDVFLKNVSSSIFHAALLKPVLQNIVLINHFIVHFLHVFAQCLYSHHVCDLEVMFLRCAV